jgi:hypothetical protein
MCPSSLHQGSLLASIRTERLVVLAAGLLRKPHQLIVVEVSVLRLNTLQRRQDFGLIRQKAPLVHVQDRGTCRTALEGSRISTCARPSSELYSTSPTSPISKVNSRMCLLTAR